MFERDEEARAGIVDILATDIALRFRKLIVKAVLKEVATKDDIDKLRNVIKDVENRLRNEIRVTEKMLKNYLKEYVDVKVEGLRKEMKSLEMKFDEKITSLEKRLEILTKFMLGTFIGIILTLVSIILTKLL